jgi:hypothetical protein
MALANSDGHWLGSFPVGYYIRFFNDSVSSSRAVSSRGSSGGCSNGCGGGSSAIVGEAFPSDGHQSTFPTSGHAYAHY